MNIPLLVYGAYGYTGRLIVEELLRRGQVPVAAGRDGTKLARVVEAHACEARQFSLKDADSIVPHLDGVQAVLHCAGPFSATASPMMAACLRAGVHYLDITGEIGVIERAAALDQRAREAGSVLMPAVGFDVVPSDCLAAMLAAELPTATHLELAFAGMERLSPGTAKTVFESLPEGGRIRRDGQIVRVPTAAEARTIPFERGPRTAMSIPWGDVSSAFYSTRIPNISVYTAVPQKQINLLRRSRGLTRLLKLPGATALGKKLIDWRIAGPSDEERASSRVELWGRVYDGNGNERSKTLSTPGGYALTVQTAVESALRVGRGDVAPGFHTPSMAFGAEYIRTFEGV